MDLSSLRTFVEVSQTGSLTRAARRLQYTQSAISRQIAGLEAATGAPLLERHARGVVLTAQGEALLPHARAILGRVDTARAAVDAVHRAETGLLRVGAIASANAGLLPTAIAGFRDTRPGVTVTLMEASSAALHRAVDGDEIDLAVVARYPGATAPPGAHLLCRDPLLLALRRGHPLAQRTDLRLRHLAQERWAEHFPYSGDLLRAAAQAEGFDPVIGYEVREWTGKLGFAAAGLGVTLVPALAATGARPDVALRDLRHPLLTRDVLVVRRSAAPPAAAVFEAALHEAAATVDTAHAPTA